jgi:hypothetical protein
MFGMGGPAAAAPAQIIAAPMRQVPSESPFKKPFLFVSNVNGSLFRAIMWRDPQESARGFDGRLSRIRTDIKARKTRSVKTGVLAQIKGYTTTTFYNMDMVGLGDQIGAPGAMNFPTIYDVIARNQDPEILKLGDATTAGLGGSDDSAFIERGIESVALMTSGGAGHPDYRDAGDDAAKIDPAILGKTGQFVLQGALNVANDTTVTC